MDIPFTQLIPLGFFVGLGWWGSKFLFVIFISKVIAKGPIKLDTED